MWAAAGGHTKAMRRLIAAGAYLDETSSLIDAPEIEAGADANLADDFGRTILFVATDMNTLDINPRPPPKINSKLDPVALAELALAHGAEVGAPLKTTLPIWCSQGCQHNPVLAEGATALLRAAMSGDMELIDILLEAGADPNVVTAEQELTEFDEEYENVPPGKTYFYENLGTSTVFYSAGRRAATVEGNQVVVGDAETKEVIASHVLAPEIRSSMHTTFMSPNGKEMWATANGDAQVFVYDAATRQQTHVIDMPNWGEPHGLVWVHYDMSGNARVVRDQGGFRGGIDPVAGVVLDY